MKKQAFKKIVMMKQGLINSSRKNKRNKKKKISKGFLKFQSKFKSLPFSLQSMKMGKKNKDKNRISKVLKVHKGLSKGGIGDEDVNIDDIVGDEEAGILE